MEACSQSAKDRIVKPLSKCPLSWDRKMGRGAGGMKEDSGVTKTQERRLGSMRAMSFLCPRELAALIAEDLEAAFEIILD
jgi:hypothetical protein